ncbi:MAG: hypothetical protein WAV15_04060 [Minisyncoccia bacterium]
MKNLKATRGISILGLLFLGFIIILVLSYFRVSVKDVVESPTGQENINYIKGETESFWDAYLAEPASYLWNDVWINIFWKGFINNMERIRDGKPTDYDEASTNLMVTPQ